MYNTKKSPDMLLLEKCFGEIKAKQNVQGNLESIRRVLSRTFNINFKIDIIENDGSKFFGMSIYPSQAMMDLMIENILVRKSTSDTISALWAKNNEWYLEIDSILLYSTQLNANPAEMVAILLHEIGHIVYSNTVPVRVHKVLRYSFMTASVKLKNLIMWKKARKLFLLAFVEACSTKNYHFINMHNERMADKYVVKMGYGENLDEFVEKLIETQGNSLINRSDRDLDHEVEMIVNWSIDNIHELEFRKSKLKRSLQTVLIESPSRFVRGVVTNISTTFFGGDSKEKMGILVTEQYLVKEYNNVIKEGFLNIFDKAGKMKKINQSDIDIISIEIERIQNTDDKIYVLDLIYDKLDVITTGLDLITQKKAERVPMSKDRLINFQTQLDKLRKQTLSVPIKDKSYGLFIKYPKGYEG